MSRILTTLSIVLLASSICFGDTVNIVATGPNANIETITQVVMMVDDGTGATLVTQNAPASGATAEADSAILQSITTSSATLNSFNPTVPTVTNDTFPAGSAPGIQVLENGAEVGVDDTGFISSLEQMHANGDLMNYLRVDGGNFTPQWDIQYSLPISSNDYLVVEERNGNTTFTVEALDINGTLIADSDLLAFSGSSYQWSIGLANTADPNNSQPQVLSVIDFDLFGTSTPIYGFRINDTGNADFKFFVATAVPEPSSAVALAIFAMTFGCRRRRRS